jgi:hypothetical protein
MHAAVAAQVTAHGAAVVLAQPLSGITFKVYVAASGARHAGLERFLLDSTRARGARILGFGVSFTVSGPAFGAGAVLSGIPAPGRSGLPGRLVS